MIFTLWANMIGFAFKKCYVHQNNTPHWSQPATISQSLSVVDDRDHTHWKLNFPENKVLLMQIDMKYIIKHIFAFNIHNSKKQTSV